MKRIVKFNNDKYGIRVGNWLTGYKFIDLVTPRFRWSTTDKYFYDCQGDLERVKSVIKPLEYTIVKDI